MFDVAILVFVEFVVDSEVMNGASGDNRGK